MDSAGAGGGVGGTQGGKVETEVAFEILETQGLADTDSARVRGGVGAAEGDL